ncbi:MAG: DUF1549 domain-containing protein, partial [Planctomycetes bacterium]|nr:DUF1549 domain-containing protein [Planctomycetota bacterium]
MRRCPARAIFAGLAAAVSPLAAALPGAFADEQTVARRDSAADFEKRVRPLFQSRCVKCHGAEKQEGGLRLDHRTPALRGGDSGRVIVPGKSGESELFRRVTSSDEFERMPPADSGKEPLSKPDAELIQHWIDAGAVWPDDGSRMAVKSEHWAYQPIEKPLPPEVETTVDGQPWSRNAIDRFVLERLNAAGIAPAPEADRHTLIRRLHYDLVGLPPAPEEVDAFVADDAPDAYEKLVDRLLASPHFGERWGRHWLDKARYADSDGYEKDNPRPDAWKYREWVIEAVNADLPFDDFTRQQLAGDLLPDAGPDERLATAFHRQTLTNTDGGTDKEQFRVEAVFDRVATTGAVWLGLTIGCAQCHSHKYDQITQ